MLPAAKQLFTTGIQPQTELAPGTATGSAARPCGGSQAPPGHPAPPPALGAAAGSEASLGAPGSAPGAAQRPTVNKVLGSAGASLPHTKGFLWRPLCQHTNLGRKLAQWWPLGCCAPSGCTALPTCCRAQSARTEQPPARSRARCYFATSLSRCPTCHCLSAENSRRTLLRRLPAWTKIFLGKSIITHKKSQMETSSCKSEASSACEESPVPGRTEQVRS